MEKCREEFENWFLSTPTGKALSAANLGYYIFERQFDEYRDRDVEMAHRGYAYQQSKVEELQTLYTQQGINMLKLQKRLDESLRILVDIKKKGLIGTQYSIFDLEKALKGEGQ